MLRRGRKYVGKPRGGRFAIVASRYNKRHTDSLLRHAKAVLAEGEAASVKVVRVPGAFEVPVVAARLARLTGDDAFDAIICLGVVLQGATSHAQHITEAVSVALANLQIETGVPVIHGVGLYDDLEQARVRCLESEHNRGREVALTALEMAKVMRGL